MAKYLKYIRSENMSALLQIQDMDVDASILYIIH